MGVVNAQLLVPCLGDHQLLIDDAVAERLYMQWTLTHASWSHQCRSTVDEDSDVWCAERRDVRRPAATGTCQKYFLTAHLPL